METKACGRCKVEYPKTTEYFFRKIYKQKMANGEIKEYKSLRYLCKKCHGQDGEDRRRLKICKQNGWDIKDYNKNYRNKIAFNKLKYKELDGIKRSTRGHIRRKIDNGYVFTGMDNYIKDIEINRRKNALKMRKYDYGHENKLTQKERNDKSKEILLDSFVCNRIKKKLGEVPQEIIQTQRLIIKLRQELNK